MQWGQEQRLRTRALEEHPLTARGGTMQYNQGPEYYWHTFTDTLRTLNISLVHLIRRDTLRAEGRASRQITKLRHDRDRSVSDA